MHHLANEHTYHPQEAAALYKQLMVLLRIETLPQ
jgi:hypothetical protein